MSKKDTAIPENRCGFELGFHPENVGLEVEDFDTDQWHIGTDTVYCCRPVWQKHKKRCIWHADVAHKSVNELRAARADVYERLDGAILHSVNIGERVPFAGCGLIGAIFDDVKLPEADFANADLRWAKFSDANLRWAKFPNANLREAEFSDANLLNTTFPGTHLGRAEFSDVNLRWARFPSAKLGGAEFPGADLRRAEFSDAHLRWAKFTNADLRTAEFSDVSLMEAEFPDTNLGKAEFSDVNLGRAKFPGANLREAEFSDAYLVKAEFPGANLMKADLTDADLREVNFWHANLQDAVLVRADCRRTTFTSALLYETVFADTRINSRTTFSDPATTFYDCFRRVSRVSRIMSWLTRALGYEHSMVSRPLCVYEENELTAEQLPDGVHPLEAARWVYRRLETLHEENALSETARDFHISKEEAERALYRERDDSRRHVKTFMRYLTNHGESVRRLLGWWIGVIIVTGVLFPFVGGIKDSDGTEYAITSFSELGTMSGWSEVLLNIYFSVITFSTIGYGDLSPAGPLTRVLVASESIAGALLMAMLIFVLGRRVTR